MPRTLIVEIVERVDEAGGHRDLGGEVEHGACVARRLRAPRHRRGCRRRTVRDLVRMALPQPVRGCAPSPGRAAVEDDDIVALAREPVGEVAADEAGAAGDEHWTERDQAWRRGVAHATSPRASVRGAPRSTRSSACWPATHSASSARPSREVPLGP